MKLPAVAIAAAFAGGILLGLSHFLLPWAASNPFPALNVLIVCILLAAGFVLALRNFVCPAAIASLGAWTALGMLAACLAIQPLPPEHPPGPGRVPGERAARRTTGRW